MSRLRSYRRGATAIAAISVSATAALVASPTVVSAQLRPDACKLLTQKEAKRVLGKPVRLQAKIRGIQGSECIYAVDKDRARVARLALGEFASDKEASSAYERARAKAESDGLTVETVRRLGNAAYWLPVTNNFERTVAGNKLTFGELTVLVGRRVYSVSIAPPSKNKAREAINLVVAD